MEHGYLNRLSLALIGGLLTLPAGGHAADLSTKVFRDWVAGCDNLRQCTALSMPGDISDSIAYLRLERTGTAAAAAKLTLNIRDKKLPKEFPIDLSLDGAPFAPAAGRLAASASSDGEVGDLELATADAEALIAAARKSTKLEIKRPGATYTLSLAGAVAALLWLDEQQGRIGTVTALIRKGEAPASRVPAPAVLPVITARATNALAAPDAKTAKTLIDAIRRQLDAPASDLCEKDREVRVGNDKVWPLDGKRVLIGMYCHGGAYNVTRAYWIATGPTAASAKPVVFPGQRDNVLVNSEYDPEAGDVDFFLKDRGIGDCGSAGSYAWTGTGFVRTRLTAMRPCAGLPPDEWVSLFRSDVKVAK